MAVRRTRPEKKDAEAGVALGAPFGEELRARRDNESPTTTPTSGDEQAPCSPD